MTYYLVPNRMIYKNSVALIGSILFFAWGEPIFVFALILSSYMDYQISLLIAPQAPPSPSLKQLLLVVGITLNTVILMGSKYLNFICEQLTGLTHHHFQLNIAIPHFPLILGISFITFHKISYLVDSYKGRAIPPRHFFDCALYLFLFPQLIAGPIIRYHDIGHQIHFRAHTSNGFLVGFTRFVIGMIKKILIADPLGLTADQVFNLSLNELSTPFAWGGILAYTLQIYFDFSGYSDMAIGLGRMMGFRFPENFNRPYIAKSVTDFWRRWHISLSNWMRLYLYIPLGGNRVSIPKTYLNLWIVFLISGIWHGASWNFVFWGAYYGFFLCLERMFNSSEYLKNITIPRSFSHILTMLVVMIGWVFFRAATLHEAWHFIKAMFGMNDTVRQVLPLGFVYSNQTITLLIIGSMLAFTAIPLPHTQLHAAWSDAMDISGERAIYAHFILAFSLLVLCAAAIVSSDYVPFLYFRF